MRKLVLLATVVFAIVAASASTANARGYTCAYKLSAGGYRVYMVVDGADNMPAFCRTFNNGAHGQRVSWAPGRVYCAWQSEDFDVRVSARAPSRTIGRMFCTLMVAKLGHADGFYRVK